MSFVHEVWRGDGLFARALRSSAWAGMGHILSQIIRLASNLVLTRLLFPEAFGLMSLVTVLMVGVAMLSDVGIGISVAQSKRGDDPAFLDTAWTIQIIRGFLLFCLIGVVAWPVSLFYAEPALLYLLPVASISVMIAGFNPMRVETAGRHLLLGRVTLLDLVTQVATIVATMLFALLYPSVWALIAGLVLGSAIRLALSYLMIPGEPSRFHIDRSAAWEIIHFGKWIVPSTAFGFILGQGDRLVLGVYLSLEMLGIYNIGQFLAAAPLMLATAITGKVLVPVYRQYRDRPSPQSARKLRFMRFALTGSVMAMLFAMALIGPFAVSFLYDERYQRASAIAVIVALVCLPQALGLSYDRGALAAGDSRNFFWVVAFRGTVQIVAFVVGAETAGLIGALCAQGIGLMVGHLSLIWLARKHGVWDALHDIVFAALAVILGALAIYANWNLLQDFALVHGGMSG